MPSPINIVFSLTPKYIPDKWSDEEVEKLPVCEKQTGSLYFKAVIFQKSKQVSVSTVVFTFLFFVQKLMCV